jgi:hypothetical protein
MCFLKNAPKILFKWPKNPIVGAAGCGGYINLATNFPVMQTTKIIPFIAVMALCISGTLKESPSGNLLSSTDGSLPAITDASESLPLNTIKLPAGFTISVYAEVDNARSMVLSP